MTGTWLQALRRQAELLVLVDRLLDAVHRTVHIAVRPNGLIVTRYAPRTPLKKVKVEDERTFGRFIIVTLLLDSFICCLHYPDPSAYKVAQTSRYLRPRVRISTVSSICRYHKRSAPMPSYMSNPRHSTRLHCKPSFTRSRSCGPSLIIRTRSRDGTTSRPFA